MPRSDVVFDRKGLIRESYRMDGIGLAECRSIFLDWAISVPSDADQMEWIRSLIALYGEDDPDHPMTSVLKDALTAPGATGRRGGARGRRGGVS